MTVETSVVIRTLNESKHLETLMQGVHRQRYQDWEIVLVDSGSTDGTLEIAERYGARIFHIAKEEFTYGRSLNLGCKQAMGRYLVFVSGHVWPVNNAWLGNLIKPFEQPLVAMVYGRQRGTAVNRLSERRDLEANFGPSPKILVHEPLGNNGNAAIRRDLWLTQPFDESLLGLEDVDWAHRAQRAGYWVYYAADSVVYHVHEESLKQVYGRHLREAIAYKRMFPGHRFSKADFAKGLVYAMVRDVLYAVRHRELRKLPQIPGTRLTEFLATFRGDRRYIRNGRDALRRSAIPQSAVCLVVTGPGEHGLQYRPLPQLGAGEVLVNVAYAGVCETDLEWDHGAGSERSAEGSSYPAFPGHEFAGLVVKTGPGVSSVKRGQKVVGRTRAGGASRYVGLTEQSVVGLPDDLPLKNAVMIEPVVACLKAIDQAGVAAGQRACVVGAGPMGNLCAQLLRRAGLSVHVVDPNERRLNLLHGLEIDTHTEMLSERRFDCCFVTPGGSLSIACEASARAATTVHVVCGGHWASDGPPDAAGGAEDDDSHTASWNEAVRLVRNGSLDLSDHTAIVEPLAAYASSWQAQASGARFKVILNTDARLGDL